MKEQASKELFPITDTITLNPYLYFDYTHTCVLFLQDQCDDHCVMWRHLTNVIHNVQTLKTTPINAKQTRTVFYTLDITGIAAIIIALQLIVIAYII